MVQEALDKARTGRTTLVVAHRLSTIRTADIIVAIEEGRVKEMGTHDELMVKEGLYHSLVTRQMEGKIILDNDNDQKLYPDLEDEMDTNKFERKDSLIGKLTRKLSRRLSRTLSTNKKDGKETAKEEAKKDVEEDLPKIQVSRLLKRNKAEMLYIIIGALASIAMASLMPVFAILFGKILGVLGYVDIDKAREESVYYALLFLGLGIFASLAQLIQGWMFGISGENLTKRLRRDTFEAMLSQEIGWYDRQENNTGALCARLSTDAGKVQGATGARVGTVLQGVFSVIIAIFIGVYYQWKLGLVATLFFPIMVYAVYVNQQIINGVDTVEAAAFEASAKVKQKQMNPCLPNFSTARHRSNHQHPYCGGTSLRSKIRRHVHRAAHCASQAHDQEKPLERLHLRILSVDPVCGLGCDHVVWGVSCRSGRD